MILHYALQFAIVVVSVSMLLCLLRLVKGPSAVDRLLALDTMFVNTICLLVLFGIWWKMDYLFEAALLIAMFGFVSTVAIAKYIKTEKVVE